MSFEATAWAWKTAKRLNALGEDGLEPGALLVLLAMCDVADEHHITYPGRETVAQWTGQGTRTVRRHTAKLEERGLIIKLSARRRRDSGLFAQDAWVLNIEADAVAPSAEAVDDLIKQKAKMARSRRSSPGAKMAAGEGQSPGAKMANTRGQNGRRSNDDPISENPVSGAGERASDDAPAPSGSTAARWQEFRERYRRHEPATCKSWFDPIRVDGDRLVVPTRFFLSFIRQEHDGLLRTHGFDLDEIEVVIATE